VLPPLPLLLTPPPQRGVAYPPLPQRGGGEGNFPLTPKGRGEGWGKLPPLPLWIIGGVRGVASKLPSDSW